MYRISRIYAGNFGYRDAWYPGVLVDLRSTLTGEPTHTILKAPNGSGKTSLLGFVFSCFDPQIKRFLPHMNDAARHFHHYFDAHGLPAVALIEFLLPRHTGQEGKRLVVGQACAMHAGQPNRTFFSFEEAEGLSLEDVPAPKLRADGRVVRNGEDVGRWAHDMRSRHPGNFQVFESQTKWQEHLERERGLDPYLFRVQIELSKREGAVDEGFLKFGSEADFLKKFFEMVLPEERGMKVRDAVSLACQKLRDYPRYDKQLLALGKLADELTPFAREAENLANAVSRTATLTAEAVAMAASMQVVKQRFESARDQEEAFAKAKAKEAEQRTKAADAAAATVEALEAEKLLREAHRARDAEAAAQKARSEAEQAIQFLDAAELLERIDQAKDRLEQITRQIAQEEQGLADFEREAREAGAVYRHVLEVEEEGARASVLRHRKAADAALEEGKRLEAENRQLQVDGQELDRKRIGLQTVQTQFDEGLSDLDRDGLVNRSAGERASDAIARHGQAATAARTDRTRLEQEAQSRRRHAQQLGAELANVQERLGGLRAQRASKDAVYVDGLSRRDELSELPVLCQAAGSAERVDPDSASTVLALDRFLVRLEADIARINVRRAELEADERSLEASDLASAGADVESVMDKLRGEGISSAQPFAHYIAKIEPDPNRARAMILSDPARYLGLAVASADDLKNAQRLLQSPPPLARPVVVSVYSDRPADKGPEGFVVPAASDAGYNFDAAGRFAKRLKEEAGQLAENLQRLTALQGGGYRAKQSLADFVAQFGDGKLAVLRAEVEKLDGEIAAAEVQVDSLGRQIATASKEAEQLDGLARAKGQESEQLAAVLARLTEFVRKFEATEGDRKAEIASLSLRISVIEKKTAANAAALKNAKGQAEQEQNLAEQFSAQAAEHARARADVSLYHDDAAHAANEYANGGQTLAVYRDRYEQARRVYDMEVDRRVGTLKIQRDHAEKERKTHEADYRNRFPSDEPFVAEARCLVGLDYKSERINRRTRLEQRTRGYNEASNRRALAEAEEAKHRDRRKYSQVVVGGLSEMDDNALAQKIVSKNEARQKAAEEARAASEASREAKGRAANNDRFASEIGTAREGLAALINDIEEGQPDEAMILRSSGLAKEAPELVKKLSAARQEAAVADKRSRDAYERVQKVVRSEAFTTVLQNLAGQLSRNSFEAACGDRDGLTKHIAQHRAAITSARDAVQADFDACLNELLGFSTEALEALKAATRKRLPDSVPYYGGKEVLQMKHVAATTTAELRRGMLKNYLENLIDDNRIPENGAHLAAEAVGMLHGGQPLGLKLIRVTQHLRLEYDEISKIPSSGGEKVMAAMLLYFVIAKLRAENRARRADGGPLILDNPFAKMNMESLWRAVRSLADAMGVQCIFATILEDKNALSVFDRLIELRPGPVNKRTERRHVEAVDVTFRSSVPA